MSRALIFLLAVFLLSGCGPGDRPFTDNSKDPEAYAQSVKRVAFGAIQSAKRSREPVDQIQVIVDELEGQEANHRPIGSYKPVYDELLGVAKKLLDDCKKASGGKPADLPVRLNELKKIAEKLPGEVQAEAAKPKKDDTY